MNKVAANWNIWDAVLEASLVVQLTLLLLIVLSVMCWAIGISKYQQFKSSTSKDDSFLKAFWKATSLEALQQEAEQVADHSAMARVFLAGYAELKSLADQKQKGPLQLTGADNLERSLKKAIDQESAAMEYRLTILANTGSTGPFIGLFGTVWGIMNSFHKIGATGSASLAVVAPGISEALFTTAVGLAAAIPAVVIYNNLISKIRRQETELNNFAADFLNIAKRNFFRE